MDEQSENPGPPTFRQELTKLLNRYSMESASNTPDFVLASFLHGTLSAFEKATLERDRWQTGGA